jgi:hypothetical protein
MTLLAEDVAKEFQEFSLFVKKTYEEGRSKYGVQITTYFPRAGTYNPALCHIMGHENI